MSTEILKSMQHFLKLLKVYSTLALIGAIVALSYGLLTAPEMRAVVGWIIFGIIAGLIAKAIVPGKDRGGVLVTILLGILGAVLGGFIGRALFYGRPSADGFSELGNLMSLVLAVIGALILLAGYRFIKARSLGS